MEAITWNELKNKRLKKTRGVSFEELIRNGELVDIRDHPSRALQEIMLLKYTRHIWVVPFVASENQRFLKTLDPSRKYTKLFQEGRL